MRGGVRKRGSKWYYYFTAGKVDGKKKTIERVGGSTRKEAEDSLRKALNEFDKCGTHIDESNISVSDYFDYWYKEYVCMDCKYNTQQNYKRVIDNHIKPALGIYKLKALTPAVLQAFLNKKRIEGLSKNSISNFYGVLSGALKLAVYPYQFIKESPMIYVKMPRFNTKKSDTEVKYLSKDEVEKILERFPQGSSFFIPVTIAFHTGLRASEICGLTWDNIDFENCSLEVKKNLVQKGREWCFDTPKTESSYRTIKIGPTLLNILKKHKLWQSENKLRYGSWYDQKPFKFYNEVFSTNDLVCTKENGELVSTDSLKYLSRVVNYDLSIEFNFHMLRHTHATMLLQDGANMKDVQKRLGHSKLSTTMDTYAHVTEKMTNDTVNIFESAIK